MDYNDYMDELDFPKLKTEEELRDELAKHNAMVEQRRMQIEQQYPHVRPRHNLMRFDDIEVWKFQKEMLEWELENGIVYP